MHLKKATTRYKGETREYAQIVRSVRREDGQTTQKVIKSLGRMESEEDWEWAESVLEAMEKGEKLVKLKELEIKRQLELGVLWAADEVWRKDRVREALAGSFAGRRCEFDLERVIFLLTVNRLYDPSSDLSACRWINEKAYTPVRVERQWIYRSLDVLVEEKDRIEENMFHNLKQSLDLSLDLVLYDLTSTYFEGEGPGLAEYGYSRDHRPDRKQLVLGVVMADGIPIYHRVWAGNTADKSTLEKLVTDLKKRFGIEKVAFVADRGVISLPNLDKLEENYRYILSTRRRKNKLAEKLLAREVPDSAGSGKVRANEVHREEIDGATRRYILCLDQETRKARLETLKKVKEEAEEELQELRARFEKSRSGEERGRPMTKQGAMNQVKKILGKNKRLFDVDIDDTVKCQLNQEAWRYERAIAGKFLLVTTTNLEPSQAMNSYKELKDVEKASNELKNLIKLRPIYHHTDKRVKGHIFICILALLIRRLMEKKTGQTFREIMDKLEQIKVNIIEIQGQQIYQRNQINQTQQETLKNLNVEKPPKILTKQM